MKNYLPTSYCQHSFWMSPKQQRNSTTVTILVCIQFSPFLKRHWWNCTYCNQPNDIPVLVEWSGQNSCPLFCNSNLHRVAHCFPTIVLWVQKKERKRMENERSSVKNYTFFPLCPGVNIFTEIQNCSPTDEKLFPSPNNKNLLALFYFMRNATILQEM